MVTIKFIFIIFMIYYYFVLNNYKCMIKWTFISDSMSRISSKIFCPINQVPLTSEIINSVRNAICVHVIFGTCTEILRFLKTLTFLNARFEHLSWFLAQFWMLFVIWFHELFPTLFSIAWHVLIKLFQYNYKLLMV